MGVPNIGPLQHWNFMLRLGMSQTYRPTESVRSEVLHERGKLGKRSCGQTLSSRHVFHLVLMFSLQLQTSGYAIAAATALSSRFCFSDPETYGQHLGGGHCSTRIKLDIDRIYEDKHA